MTVKAWSVVLGSVAATTAFVVMVGASGASGGGAAISATPEREAPQLACGNGLTMVIHEGLYVPGTNASPTQSADAALTRFVDNHYPNAPRARFAKVQEDDAQSAKYHVRAVGGRLLASFLVSQAEGEYWVEQVALCEATAKGWAR